MDLHEWALIAFTVLAQMSVGAFVILGCIHLWAMRRAGTDHTDLLSTRALLAIGPVLILGMIASLFHLGNPMNAYLAVSNLDSSWLSREILAGIVFAVLGGVFAFMQWRKVGSFALRNVVACLAAIAGLTLVFAMSKVYMLEAQPSWNSAATAVSFFSTTFLLGGLAVGVAFAASHGRLDRVGREIPESETALLRDSMRWIALLSIGVLGVILVTAPLHVASLSAGLPAAQASGELLFHKYGLLLAIRIALAFVGAGVIALFLYRNAVAPGSERLLGTLAYVAFGLVFVAEVIGRFLFYATLMNVAV